MRAGGRGHTGGERGHRRWWHAIPAEFPSDFRFLLSQHPPVGIDSSNVVDYALTALFLTDEISGWAELVRDTTSVPDARVTWVTVSSGGRLLTYGTTVDRVSGEMVIIKQPEDR